MALVTGSNMVAAFKQTTAAAEEPPSSSEEDSPMMESDSEAETEIDDLRYKQIDMDRTPYVVHTLQLVVHMVQKEASVKRLLDKARSIVNLFRKSSIATQKLLEHCGLILLNNCLTCWSSTFNMIARLLKLKESVCQIANDIDGTACSLVNGKSSHHCMTYCCPLQNILKPSRVTPCPCPCPL
ncbi:hypothetical protein AB205_0022880 [Aquarana catesbeiana]|uniref:Uncharacterized protein n=1 Tax=Aquarana catesbeiana TaxID=8400 RepID=A0A2G9RHI2_AQUCT|nr:hypothetical protein AB205_0022880 [Aquarana catesbeiana]